MNFWQRLIQNPKTTLGGTAIGAGAMAAGAMIMSQAQCDFSQVQWLAVLGTLFAAPTTMGALSTDNGKAVGSAEPVMKPVEKP